MSAPAYKTFKGRRLARRNMGFVLLAVAVLLLFALRFPGPKWLSVGGALVSIALGWCLLLAAYSPPIREVLLLAQERRQALTPADLVTEMDLGLADARSVLETMARQGLLQRADNAEAYLLAGDAPRRIEK